MPNERIFARGQCFGSCERKQQHACVGSDRAVGRLLRIVVRCGVERRGRGVAVVQPAPVIRLCAAVCREAGLQQAGAGIERPPSAQGAQFDTPGLRLVGDRAQQAPPGAQQRKPDIAALLEGGGLDMSERHRLAGKAPGVGIQRAEQRLAQPLEDCGVGGLRWRRVLDFIEQGEKGPAGFARIGKRCAAEPALAGLEIGNGGTGRGKKVAMDHDVSMRAAAPPGGPRCASLLRV